MSAVFVQLFFLTHVRFGRRNIIGRKSILICSIKREAAIFFNTMPAIRLFLSLSLFLFAQYVCELLMEKAQAKIVGD